MKNLYAKIISSCFLFLMLMACSEESTLEETPIIEQDSVSTPMVTEKPVPTPMVIEKPKPTFEIVQSAKESDIVPTLLLNILGTFIQNIEVPEAVYNVRPINITYTTKEPWTGQEIKASGAILIPTEIDFNPAIISLHHATIDTDLGTPSQQVVGVNEITLAKYYASLGYIVSFPDYIGYGSSSEINHPYEDLASLGSTSHDMLKATKEYLEVQEIKHSKELFLVGYSEGATATIAHAELAQKNNDFELLGSFAGGGSFDKLEFIKLLSVKDEVIESVPNYIWALNTLNQLNQDLNRSWSFYLNEPNDQKLDAYGPINGLIPNDLIELNPKKLFKNSFIEAILSGEDNEFITALNDNSIESLNLNSPISLFYIPQDEVTFSDILSKKTHQYLLDQQIQSELIEIKGENHTDGAIDFFFRSYQKIEKIMESRSSNQE